MKTKFSLVSCAWMGLFISFLLCWPTQASSVDIRGMWVGNAKGTIFGAEGSMNITYQRGEDIYGIIEGGNFFGRARFAIQGTLRGNEIYGRKDGHTFKGFLYADGTIRGVFRAADGDTYDVFLQRAHSYWGWGTAPGMW
jgi:hypothetical protein